MFTLFWDRGFNEKLIKRRVRLYRLAMSWCHDAMLADDLVQETLNKAIKKRDQLKELEKLDAWLFKILHNTWMEHLRKQKPTIDLDDVDPLDEDTPENLLSDEQIIIKVQQAVSQLPMAQRQVVTLVDLEGFSYLEVSEILEIPMGTVMSRLNRARVILKRRLVTVATSTNRLRSVK